jgi:hypothetical protein
MKSKGKTIHTKLYTQIPKSGGRLRKWNTAGRIGGEDSLLDFVAR